MRNFIIIALTFTVLILSGCSTSKVEVQEAIEVSAEKYENNATVEEEYSENENNNTEKSDENLTKELEEVNNEVVVDVNVTEQIEENISQKVDDNSTNTVDKVEQTYESSLSSFEKLFVNHSAYRYYLDGIKMLYEKNYKSAYEFAMKAKMIYDNTLEKENLAIALPYLPSYVRESSYSPKRIYYKMVKYRDYELKRLIVKAKLISPPIASIIINRTSTYVNIVIKNYGDLPLDDFEVLINDESIASFEKILPNEEKKVRVESSPILYELSFKEKYGFAPKSIMLDGDE